MGIAISFDKYLSNKNIQLTKTQKAVSDLLMINNEPIIREFLYNKQTGKTFLFSLLDEFFSQSKS